MRSDNLVSLAAVEHPPVAEVIDMLESMLERARAGQIIGVAIVAAEVGRYESTGFAIGEGAVSTLVCGTERLKLRLLGVA